MSEWGLAPLKKREPTELELLIQKTDWAALKWEWPAAQPEPSATEPRGEEPPLPEPRGEDLPLPEPRGEAKSIPPPQPRPPPLRSSPASLRQVPRPLLLDTLPVFLDLPVLDLVPKSLQHWPQLCPWFPAPLSPSTQTSLGCCQTSLLLPLLAASLPLGDRTSLRRSPGEDLCPLLHPPVPRPTLRSPLSNRWGPSSPVRGPYLAGPGRGPIHPQVRPWKRAKIDICGLEGLSYCPATYPPPCAKHTWSNGHLPPQSQSPGRGSRPRTRGSNGPRVVATVGCLPPTQTATVSQWTAHRPAPPAKELESPNSVYLQDG
ncbi:UNVERIFIED_CONTAM: hypothetical protein FKN15_069290 [Acipenser sinensis]